MIQYNWYLSWNIYHKFALQYKILKQVLWNFRRDKRFLEIFLTCFSDPELCWQACRSTGRLTDVHRLVHVCWHSGPVGRAADRIREPCSLYLGGRPSGRPDQRVCSLYLGGRPCGRPSCPNGHISDRWRSAGRPTASLSGCQISLTASFLFGLYKPHFFGILAKVFTREKLLFP